MAQRGSDPEAVSDSIAAMVEHPEIADMFEALATQFRRPKGGKGARKGGRRNIYHAEDGGDGSEHLVVPSEIREHLTRWD
jgi:hypothetical protein